jgi:hypothetical protein
MTNDVERLDDLFAWAAVDYEIAIVTVIDQFEFDQVP